jgi:hypothetical protein
LHSYNITGQATCIYFSGTIGEKYNGGMVWVWADLADKIIDKHYFTEIQGWPV